MPGTSVPGVHHPKIGRVASAHINGMQKRDSVKAENLRARHHIRTGDAMDVS
ncbi:MAG TPA: hypothetical protein V6C76_10695 [Drouetiella sp.]